MKQNQHGAAHIIMVVAVVFVVIVGLLGFVFWKNLTKQEPAAIQDTNKKGTSKQATKPKDTLQTFTMNKAFGEEISFSYPDTWKLQDSIDGPVPLNIDQGATVETVEITPPNKSLSVRFSIGAGGGLGGACVPEDAGVIRSVEYEAAAGFPEVQFARIVTRTIDNRYVTGARLLDNNTMNSLSPGVSACSLGLLVFRIPHGDTPLVGFDASIHLPVTMNLLGSMPGEGFETEKEANSAFTGDTYEQARAILLSFTVK